MKKLLLALLAVFLLIISCSIFLTEEDDTTSSSTSTSDHSSDEYSNDSSEDTLGDLTEEDSTDDSSNDSSNDSTNESSEDIKPPPPPTDPNWGKSLVLTDDVNYALQMVQQYFSHSSNYPYIVKGDVTGSGTSDCADATMIFYAAYISHGGTDPVEAWGYSKYRYYEGGPFETILNHMLIRIQQGGTWFWLEPQVSTGSVSVWGDRFTPEWVDWDNVYTEQVILNGVLTTQVSGSSTSREDGLRVFMQHHLGEADRYITTVLALFQN
jgi:hypothetical protein